MVIGVRLFAMSTATPVSTTAIPIRSPREDARRLLRWETRFLRAKGDQPIWRVEFARSAARILGAGTSVSKGGQSPSSNPVTDGSPTSGRFSM